MYCVFASLFWTTRTFAVRVKAIRTPRSDYHMTAYMPAVSRSIVCNHNRRVQECDECNALLPGSFWNRMRWQRFQTEPNTYHVSTLTNCLAKAYFERTSPTDEALSSAWAKLRGTMLHYLVRSLGWSELAVKMQFELDGEEIIVSGLIDAFEPETATIYDLKTSRFVKWQAEKGFIPRETHIARVQCYATLLGSYGVAVSRLVLIYVDDKEIVPKEVPLGNRKQWMIERATTLHRSLKGSLLPKPETGSSCKYCPFIGQCPRSSEALILAEAVR
jgi:CRISPR/Cas system-associated exonuclease Cas4 (RecB family)